MRFDAEYVFGAVADERRGIASLIDSLDDSQLAAPSLCRGWDVKTVAAHLVSVFTDSFWTFQWMALRRGGFSRGIDALAQRRAQLPASQIAAALRQGADRRLSPPITGPLSGLADVMVHRGDIVIPLALPFNPDLQRVALALEFLTGRWPLGFVPRGRLRGLCLRATDIDATWGRGSEIFGPAAALMMVTAGRTALLYLLDGPGLSTLEHRLGNKA